MSKLGVVEDTLFVPMLGRIYASEHCPNVLYDQKALELKNKLPTDLLGKGGQSQYTPCWPPPSDPTIWIEPFRPFWNTVRTA